MQHCSPILVYCLFYLLLFALHFHAILYTSLVKPATCWAVRPPTTSRYDYYMSLDSFMKIVNILGCLRAWQFKVHLIPWQTYSHLSLVPHTQYPLVLYLTLFFHQ